MLILSKDSANREQNSHARLSFFAEMQLILSKDSANRTLLHSISTLIIPNIFAYYIFYSYFFAVKQRGAYMAEIIPYEPEPGNAGVGIVHTATLCLRWLSPQHFYSSPAFALRL